jgi:hypothetical protein
MTENQPRCLHSAADLLSIGRDAAITLRISCIGPAYRPSIQCQIGVPIRLGPRPQASSGCDETALGLTTEQQWDCRETASVVLTDHWLRPSCRCGCINELGSRVQWASFDRSQLLAHDRLIADVTQCPAATQI